MKKIVALRIMCAELSTAARTPLAVKIDHSS